MSRAHSVQFQHAGHRFCRVPFRRRTPVNHVLGMLDGTGTVILSDADGDGVCDDDEVAGCQDPTACNYNAAATDSATCDFLSCLGCTSVEACNFDETATQDDGTCVFADAACEECAEDGQLCCLTLTVMAFVTKMKLRGA